MDTQEVVVELRQVIMQKLKEALQPIADAVSPNVVVNIHWSLNDPIDIPKMPDEDDETATRKKRKVVKEKAAPGSDRRAKYVWPEGFTRAQRQPFYAENCARKRKGQAPLTVEEYVFKKAKPEKN